MSAQDVLFDAPGPRARARHRIYGAIGLVAALAMLTWVVLRMADKGQFAEAKWSPFLEWGTWDNYLIPGMVDTLKAAAIAIVLSMMLGLLLAMLRMSDIAPVRWASSIWVEFFRAVPVLILMIFSFSLLIRQFSSWSPDAYNPLIAVVTGLTLYNSAVICEVIRTGVGSLPAGQREAGLSIGLSPSQVRRSVLVPQALTSMLPTLVSQIIVINKDSALGYIITYTELLTRSRRLGSAEANVFIAYLVAALLFILINYAISKIAERIESRQRRKKRPTGPTADGGGDEDSIRLEGVDPSMEHNTRTG